MQILKKKNITSKEERYIYIYDPSIFHGQKHAFCNLAGLAKSASSKKLIMRIRKFLVGSEIGVLFLCVSFCLGVLKFSM